MATAPSELVKTLTKTFPLCPGKTSHRKLVVREGGVEPPHPFEYTDLNRARLPIPPLALTPFGAKRTIQAPI